MIKVLVEAAAHIQPSVHVFYHVPAIAVSIAITEYGLSKMLEALLHMIADLVCLTPDGAFRIHNCIPPNKSEG